MSMNIFERASRKKLRFTSPRGDLTTEQLWDFPLQSNRSGSLDLDQLARTVHAELKTVEEGSFVTATADPRKTDLELRLEILKHIIKSKLADKAAAEERVVAAERKRKLYAALDAKEESELAGKSKEDILKEIEKLG